MDVLAKGVFVGKWKSFKLFRSSGEIKLNSDQAFKEFIFSADGTLIIEIHKGLNIERIVETKEWSIELSNKRHYLKVAAHNLIYEVISVNHTILVLLDSSTKDKIFFAIEAHWNSFLQSNKLYSF